MIKYGLISETDARCLEKTIDLVIKEFNTDTVEVTEIGLFNCETAKGIYDYVVGKSFWIDKSDRDHKWGGGKIYKCNYTGIDNEKDKQIIAPEWMKLIIGNSNEVYNQLEDNSQHLIFVDGCHCFAHVISDFFCYAPKVKVGGYMAFHDTGVHIKPFKDFQHGDKENPDAYISVRKALYRIGLMNWRRTFGQDYEQETNFKGWRKIFDEADETNEAGGITVFKKLY